MYILKNALKSITRNKGRNIMIMIIVLVIAVSACISLSIREAANTAKENTMNGLSITAQLSFDRTSLMQNMKSEQNSDSSSKGFNRGNFDFSALSGTSLTIDDYVSYTQYLSDEDSYYYTITASFDGAGDLLAYGNQEESETSDSSPVTENQQNSRSMGGFKGQAAGDFTAVGFSSYDAMLSKFGEDGTYTVTDGEMFPETGTDYICIISDELAMYNDLSVGDTLTLKNPNCEDETYDIVISGIYTNSAADEGNSLFSRSDPANNIYMSATALSAICDASEKAGTSYVNEMSGETVSAAVEGETSFTYVLASVENYEAFKSLSEDAGLPENYVLSSADLSSYENSLTPLNTLSKMTGWFFLIVLIIGGIILVVINMFNLRERKYEVGVLAAIGMKKRKIMTQFVCELLIITFIAIAVGAVVGAAASVPVTNTLLEQQIEKAEDSQEQLNSNFGFGGDKSVRGSHTQQSTVEYIDSVSSATNLTVILEMILVGILLTIISALAAMVTILRYEPLQILSNRS